LRTVEEGAVLLVVGIVLDEVGALKHLEDHARGDDGRDTELHERATVGGKNHTHPVEGVGLDGRKTQNVGMKDIRNRLGVPGQN